MQIPSDYGERVYAGVLGKIIGVYLGRPFESWLYDKFQLHSSPLSWYTYVP